MITVQQILNKVNNVDNDIHYWFVRTNYGEHFYEFTEGNYIAIGWDYFTLDEIESQNATYIKEKIIKQDKLDPNNSKDKIKITSAYNKIQTFLNLKKNDIVVVPSKNSDRLAFGRVIDDKAYEVKSEIGLGTHFKRRKINWVTIKNIRSLPPIFYQVKSNQHAVSNIDRFAPHIDKVMGNLFKKGDETHFVLNIEKEDNIPFEEVRILMDNIQSLLHEINNEFEFNDNLDEFFVKMNFQSKGSMEFIKAGQSLTILAFLLSLTSCNQLDNQLDPEIRKLVDNNRAKLEKTGQAIDTLKINTDELTKPFNNGK